MAGAEAAAKAEAEAEAEAGAEAGAGIGCTLEFRDGGDVVVSAVGEMSCSRIDQPISALPLAFSAFQVHKPCVRLHPCKQTCVANVNVVTSYRCFRGTRRRTAALSPGAGCWPSTAGRCCVSSDGLHTFYPFPGKHLNPCMRP